MTGLVLVLVLGMVAFLVWATMPRRRWDPWEPGDPERWARRRLVNDRDV